MTQAALVSPHDGVGTNLFGHVLRGRLMRVVPRPNEAINETWIADRDRYSYEGIYSADRLEAPMVREGGEWKRVSWEVALETAAKGLQGRGRGSRDARQPLGDGRRALSAAQAHARAGFDQHRSSPAPGGFPRPGRRSGRAGPRRARHRGHRPARCAAGRRLQPAPRSAGARASRAQGREARREGRLPESGALRLPVPGGRVLRDAAGAAARRPRGHLLRLPRWRGARRSTWRRSSPARRPTSGTARLRPRSSPGRSAPSGWARSRCVIRPTPICAPWPRASPPPPAPRSACWPKAAMPRAPISPAPCRIASRAASRPPPPGKNARELLAQPQKAYLLFGGIEPWADGAGRRCAARTLGGAGFVVAATPYADETLKSVAHVLLPISHVRRDLRHVREPRRPVAELCRRGQAAGRSASGLEGAARARQSRRRRGLRLPVVRRSARGTARAVRRTSPRRPTRVRTKPKVSAVRMRASSTCRCTRSTRCCAARRRCSARAKARARRSPMAEARAHERAAIGNLIS